MVWIKYKGRIHNKTIGLEVNEEVARYLWVNDIYCRRLMKKVYKYECSYFETISDDGDEIEFIESIKDESVDIEQEVDNKIFAEIIWKVAEKLQPLQKEILIERFKKDMKLCDIAKRHNMSKSALTQFLKTTYKHFVFFLARDKDFIKTDFWQSHCKDFTDEFIDTLEEGLTNGELMADWLLVFKKSAVSPGTFEGIIRNFRLHIEPVIGNMKIYDVDTFVVQKVINKLIEENYSNNVVKKNKHLISQFFEYAIGNKWVMVNPTLKVKIRVHDRKVYDRSEKYKALPPEVRTRFLEALNKDEANFIKPMCIVLMFAGLRIGEACALQWKNVDFENKTLKIERSITTIPKFDSEGKILNRVTVVGDTKTTCSVREIPIADIVVETLKKWKEKQTLRQQTNKEVTAELTASTSFIFANDDGSVRTYSGCRMIFDRFKRRNGLDKYNIHFHGLRHTFSNMLFEMNENPKVIQQLLRHRDVKLQLQFITL